MRCLTRKVMISSDLHRRYMLALINKLHSKVKKPPLIPVRISFAICYFHTNLLERGCCPLHKLTSVNVRKKVCSVHHFTKLFSFPIKFFFFLLLFRYKINVNSIIRKSKSIKCYTCLMKLITNESDRI